MKALRALLTRLGGLFGSAHQEHEFTAELNSHVQLHTEDNIRAGMTPQQARRTAFLQLGGVEKTRQAYRERSTLPLIENLLQDLRFAQRQLGRNPGFAITAILILSLGICANVAIFAFVDAALIKPLPYKQPSRLVALFESIPLGPRFHLSIPDYRDWKRMNTVFSSLDVYEPAGFTMNTPQGAQRADGARVSDGFFDTLGVAPVLGRGFRTGEDLPSAPSHVLLSYGAWQKYYGGRKDVLGQTVTLDGAINTIIGVLPREFHFAPAEPADYWTTLHEDSKCRGCHGLYGVARLKDGVDFKTAFAQLKTISSQLERQYPDTNRDQVAFALPLPDVIVGDIRPVLLLLASGAALLLLIAAVNVASLLLVRAESRKREIAVRGALGASNARLLQQFITEGLLLASCGALLGISAAYGLMRLLNQLIPKDILASMPYLQNLGMNDRVILFALGISVVAGALFSFTPVLRLKLNDLRDGLTDGGRNAAGTMWRRFGANLVIIELATAMVLLVSAGLLGQSFYRLLQVDPGLNPAHLATMQIGLQGTAPLKDEQYVALQQQIIQRLSSLPGVQSAAIASNLPVGDGDGTTQFVVVGAPDKGQPNEVPIREVSSGYFSTLQTRLRKGRYFTEADNATSAPVVIINQALARQYFSGVDPLGKRINYRGAPASSAMLIVGLLDDMREGPLDESPRPALYVPFNQHTRPFFSIVLRTSKAEQAMFPTIAAALHQLNPNLSTYRAATMQDRIHDSQAAYLHRASAWLVGGFAALALLLGVVGLYGVIAYSVSQRTREIGVRMALGAQRSSVYRLILGEAGWLTALGIGAGLVCSLGAAMLMRKLLFGVPAWDVPTFLAVAFTLAVASLLASYIPARRQQP